MAKKKPSQSDRPISGQRRNATPTEAKRIREAIADEKKHRDATLAQAREMKAAVLASRGLVATLRAERERQGLSLADLKQRTGISREAISRLENLDTPNPTLQTLARLASAMGLEIDVRAVNAP